jgi:hypothetical protein
MGGHQSAAMGKSEWITPPGIIKALGPFELDPCASESRPWETAARYYTIHDNGLAKPWSGRVWLNPPYGREAAAWLARLAAHGDGVALIFARTETEAFFEHVWAKAHALLFIRGRVTFHHSNGRLASKNSGAPSCLIAYGGGNMLALEHSGIDGKLLRL